MQFMAIILVYSSFVLTTNCSEISSDAESKM